MLWSHTDGDRPPLIRFPSAGGITLEGELRHPDGPARGTAVLSHPDPRHGGSKDHPLLWAIRNDLASARGLVVLAFNFRGVMGSEGERTNGVEEPDDVFAAIARVREEAPGPTVAAGWSFGANVALRAAARDERIARLALVGMPLGEAAEMVPPLDDETLARVTIPVLLVAGDGDPFCPVGEAEAVASRLPDARVDVVEGGDHYFPKREREVAELVGAFLGGAVAQPER